MYLLSFPDSPLQVRLCFHHVFENLERQAAEGDGEKAIAARDLLAELAAFPEFKEGITDASQVLNNTGLIRRLLSSYFSPGLTLNEIKAVNIPYSNLFFNHTERFKNIMQAAGEGFEINIRDFDQHQFYIMSCCIILNDFYGTRLDFSKPLFYDIPTANGVVKHYRILYNADFLDIYPTPASVAITPGDIQMLLDNYDNLALWQEKFPPGSWLMKGFAIITLIDTTVESAVSIFKEKLIGPSVAGLQQSIDAIFRSIFNIPDIIVGYTVYNPEDNTFNIDAYGQQVRSFILPDGQQKNTREVLCLLSYHTLIERQVYFAISNTEVFLASNPAGNLARHFIDQGIHSFILAPVVKNKKLYGVLEVVSFRNGELNSINAHKLQVVMPFMTDTIERLDAELQNEVQAVIQDRFTAIHGSVGWRFREEALQHIMGRQQGKEYTINPVVFPDVYPLYGQIDIKGSSEARNTSVQKDLQCQMQALLVLLKSNACFSALLANLRHQLDAIMEGLVQPVKSDTEQAVNSFLGSQIHPQLTLMADAGTTPAIRQYFGDMDKQSGAFHHYRRKYDTTIVTINDKMAGIIDGMQTAAQAIFPHYYERFKTDGVEHNLYIGASITKAQQFDIQHLKALRLWQLQVLCTMGRTHHQLKPTLPYPLDVTTLVLVYHSTIAIRFRMDEKRFDVDGSYNARFEIVKKRIDKAYIKGRPERITQPGKLSIVFSTEAEGQEYRQYIATLQSMNLLGNTVEQFEVEDLQGISGLRVLLVGFPH